MPQFSFTDAVNLLSTAGFADAQAHAVARAFSKAGRPDRIELLGRALDAASSGVDCTIDVGIGVKQAITFDPGKTATLCHFVAHVDDLSARKWLVNRLGTSAWPTRLPLLCSFLFDSEPDIQRHAYKYLAGISLPTYEVLKAACFQMPEIRESTRDLDSGGDVDATGNSLDVEDVGLSAEADEMLSDIGGEILFSQPPKAVPPVSAGASGAVRGPTTLQRFTHVDFRPSESAPAGSLSFALRVKAGSTSHHAVDVRVLEGRDEATVLVFASSSKFVVTPTIQAIKVLRNRDSEDAVFAVDAVAATSDGDVSLLIYDDVGLLGSLAVPLSRVMSGEQVRLELGADGPQLHRDPATAPGARVHGWTIQASVRAMDQRIVFHAHMVPEQSGGPSRLLDFGHSPERFDSSTVQQALEGLRTVVDQIEKGIDEPQTLGAASTAEALEYLAMNLSGYGLKISDDILSREVLTVLANLPEGTAVQWVVEDQTLDAIPWELARDPITRRALNERIVLLRIPGRRPRQANGPLEPRPAPTLRSPSRKLVYVLGDNVYAGNNFDPVRQTIKAVRGHEVATNFESDAREAVTAVNFKARVRDADVVYVLCHGNVDDSAGLYLKLESNLLGRLSPANVRDLDFSHCPLVFVNACSSSTATWSVGGFTTFGWSFMQAGAGVFIGALAPVPTTLAMRFAELFFDAHLGRGVPVPQALRETRRVLAGESDPTWILYTAYGDLSRMSTNN